MLRASAAGAVAVKHTRFAPIGNCQLIEADELTSLALLRLMTNAGCLERAEVSLLSQKHLGALLIPIYLYTSYRKGVQAEERS
ncbi:MAG: hypothetical protein HYR56_06785 [Acidobacteria bacterium]|nr:hypothetical protein [Acidobacteriota bacterium]